MILYTILYILLFIPVKLFFPVKFIGKKNVPKKTAYILCCNHYSWKDIFILSVGIGGYRKIIAKKELGKCFLVRGLASGVGAVLVDRHSSDLKSIRTCIKALKNGRSLIIFPEGTRNRTDSLELQEVKQGAALIAVKGGAPIVPAIMFNRPRFFRKNYVYVDEPFTLDSFSEGRLDSGKLAEAASEVSSVMNQTRAKLVEFVESKKAKKSKNKDGNSK